MTGKQTPTPYEWAGGVERIQALFKAFYSRVPSDPLLGPVFAGMPAEHFETVAHFVSEVLGGPTLYTGDGRHSHYHGGEAFESASDAGTASTLDLAPLGNSG